MCVCVKYYKIDMPAGTAMHGTKSLSPVRVHPIIVLRLHAGTARYVWYKEPQ